MIFFSQNKSRYVSDKIERAVQGKLEVVSRMARREVDLTSSVIAFFFCFFWGSYHKRQISDPPTPLPT